MLYFYSVKSKWQQEYPDIKYAELVKKISQEWTKVDSTIKEQFQKQHDEQQVIYKQKINEYNNSITKEQRVLLIKNLTEKKGAVSKGQVKQVCTYSCAYTHISILKLSKSDYLNLILIYFYNRNFWNLGNQKNH